MARNLIVSDGTARRQKERRLYNRIAAALEREARKVRRFEEQDKPEFERWVDARFEQEKGAVLAAERRVSELRAVIADSRQYAAVAGMSERRAYERLMAAKDAGMEQALWQDLFAAQAEPGDAEPEYARPGEERYEDSEPAPTSPRSGTVTDYLKGLYRRLVRILHPDVQTDGGTATAKLWHEVQSAYEWADVQTMERLYKSVVKDDGSKVAAFSLDSCPIGEIIELRKDMERRLADRVRETDGLERHPAWDFAGTHRNERRLRVLTAQVAKALAADLARAEQVAAMLAKVIDKWTKAAARPSRRSRARRS